MVLLVLVLVVLILSVRRTYLHARDFLGTLEGHSLFVPLSALSRKVQSLLFPLSLLRGQLSAVLILDSTLGQCFILICECTVRSAVKMFIR